MAELMTIARPYAEAVFTVAKEEGELNAWSESLANIATIVSDETMQAFMSNPETTDAQVAEVINAVLGGKAEKELDNLLIVMSENKRLQALPFVSELFEVMKAEEEKKVRATVISARAATVEQKKKLSAALNAKFDAEVEITYEEDPSLIAGIKIIVGDWAIDGSALSQLKKLGAAIAQ